jgi:hypothetical protein
MHMTSGIFGDIAAAGVFMHPVCAEAKGKIDPAADSKEKFHIYLAFGQSNMAGYIGPPLSTSGQASPQSWVESYGFSTPPANFVVMAAANDNKNPYNRKKGEWYPAKPPLVRNNTGLSPADFFGRTIAEAVANKGIKVGVIAVAVDGCQINLFSKDKNVFKTYVRAQADWMRNQAEAYVDSTAGSTIPTADFETEDYPYQRLVDLAKIAKREGVIKGIIMHQGESGGNMPGKTYAQSVRQIYNDLCGDLGLEKGKIPFLAGQAVGNNNSNISSIPGAFSDLPDTAFVISSADCAAWTPGSSDQNQTIHFSFDGYKKLGTRYGEKMLELLY